jgi:hypothetical protein
MDPETADDIKRHFNVVAEGLRSEIRLVAEAHLGTNDRLDSTNDRLDRIADELRTEIRIVAKSLQEFRTDIAGEFRSLRGRITSLEGRVTE